MSRMVLRTGINSMLAHETPNIVSGQTQRTSRRRARKLFMLASAGVLALVAAWTAVSFMAAQGRAGTGATFGDARPSVEIASGVTLPASFRSLRYTTQIGSDHRIRRWQQPSWQPIPGVPVVVNKPGDLALVDTTQRSTPLTATLYITNLAELRARYQSFAFRIGVYETTTPRTPGNWRKSPNALTTFLTDATGKISFSLPAGRYYDLTIEHGGSLLASVAGTGSYSPRFFVTTS